MCTHYEEFDILRRAKTCGQPCNLNDKTTIVFKNVLNFGMSKNRYTKLTSNFPEAKGFAIGKLSLTMRKFPSQLELEGIYCIDWFCFNCQAKDKCFRVLFLKIVSRVDHKFGNALFC